MARGAGKNELEGWSFRSGCNDRRRFTECFFHCVHAERRGRPDCIGGRDSRNYDLSINSSRMGIEKTADFLESYIKERIAESVQEA